MQEKTEGLYLTAFIDRSRCKERVNSRCTSRAIPKWKMRWQYVQFVRNSKTITLSILMTSHMIVTTPIFALHRVSFLFLCACRAEIGKKRSLPGNSSETAITEEVDGNYPYASAFN